MIKLLNLLTAVEVIQHGRASFTGSDGDIGLVHLGSPISGQGARVLRVDSILVQLPLLGVSNGSGGDCVDISQCVLIVG